MVVAMAVIPTADRPGPGRRAVRLRRQALRPAYGRRCCAPASTCRRCCRSRWPASSGLDPRPRERRAQRAAESGRARARCSEDWLGDPKLALYSVMGVMVWVQIGFPLVVFMAGLQRVDPALYEAAEIDGACGGGGSGTSRFRRSARRSTSCCLLHHRRAQGASARSTSSPRAARATRRDVPAYFSLQTFFEKTQVGYGAAIATVLTLIIVRADRWCSCGGRTAPRRRTHELGHGDDGGRRRRTRSSPRSSCSRLVMLLPFVDRRRQRGQVAGGVLRARPAQPAEGPLPGRAEGLLGAGRLRPASCSTQRDHQRLGGRPRGRSCRC